MPPTPDQVTKPFGVISVYNDNPSYLYDFFSEIAILDNSDRENIYERPSGAHSFKKTENVGHSLANFLEWIVQNYESLPNRMAFVKSNVVPRHIDLNSFTKLVARQNLTMLWRKSGLVGNHFQESQLLPHFYIERNNSWFLRSAESEFFTSFNDLLSFVYATPQSRKFIAFSPGACYLVTKHDVLNAPKHLYEFLLRLSAYKFFPPEAYAVERILWTIFSSSEEVNSRFNSSAWVEDFARLRGSSKEIEISLALRLGSALEDLACRVQSR